MNAKTFKLSCILASLILGLLVLTPKASAGPVEPTFIALDYHVSLVSPDGGARQCSLDGYLGGSFYTNRHKTKVVSLEPYTSCFYYMVDDNNLWFGIAKPFTAIVGKPQMMERFYLKSSPVPGDIKPYEAEAARWCVEPGYYTDEELTQIVNDAFQRYVPGCQGSESAF